MKKMSVLLVSLIVAMLLSSIVFAQNSTGSQLQDTYSLNLQALKDIDNNTDLVIGLTPNQEGISNADALKKVQLKSYTLEGKLAYTKNFKDIYSPNGTGNIKLDDVKRYQPLDVMVSVQNEQTRNTEILRGETKVLLRPDLTVSKVGAPEKVFANAPFTVNAGIKELNGDLGCKTKVQITKDGVVLDSADSVEVSAGGSSDLVFMLKLSEPGVYNLDLSVLGTAPGEYDASNNDRSFTVEVVNPFSDTKAVDYYSYYYYTPEQHTNEVAYDWEGNEVYTTKVDAANEVFNVSSYINEAIDLKGSYTVELTGANGTKASESFTGIELKDSGYGYKDCNLYNPENNSYLYVWQNSSETHIYYNRLSGYSQTSSNWNGFWDVQTTTYAPLFLKEKGSVTGFVDIISNMDTHYGGYYNMQVQDLSRSWDEWQYSEWPYDNTQSIHRWGIEENYGAYGFGTTTW